MTSTGAHRLVSTPLRRGAAAVAVTGGAFSLIAAASPLMTSPDPSPDIAPAAFPGVATAAFADAVAAPPLAPGSAAVVPAAGGGQLQGDAVLLRSSFEPVSPATEAEAFDAGELVKAVQLAEQEAVRLAAEEAAVAERAEQEAAAAEEVAAAEEAAAEERREREERAAAPRATPTPDATPVRAASGGDCGITTSSLGAVKAHVRTAAEFLGCLYGEPTILGVAGRAGSSDHPSGRALDFMVDRGTGDALAECALRNKEALGITYVIWRQRINHGRGWEGMEDRGGVTANHMDHVHLSFGAGAGGKPVAC